MKPLGSEHARGEGRCHHAPLLRPCKARIERRAVVGMRDTGYGVEALVERALVPAGLTLERPGMEDVMLFMAKG